MTKSVWQFVFLIITKHKKRILFLIFYYFISGYLFAYWPVVTENAAQKDRIAQFLLIVLAFLQLSFDYWKEVLVYPIYNFIIYKLKLDSIKEAHNLPFEQIEVGKHLVRFQRLYNVRSLAKTFDILTSFGSILSSIAIMKEQSVYIGYILWLLFFVYSVSVVFTTSTIHKRWRLKAWTETENAGNVNAQVLTQTLAVRQELYSKTEGEESFKQEYKAWHDYYLKSNVVFGSLNIILVLLLIIGIIGQMSVVFLLVLWNFARYVRSFGQEFKSVFSSWIDLSVFFSQVQEKAKQRQFANDLNLKEVYLKIKDQKQGPINFNSKARILTLTGKNAIGKTRLALAISNIVEFNGTITSPATLYISFETKPVLKKEQQILSKGENAQLVLNQALKTNAKLILIDELLDCISDGQLVKVLLKLKNSKKHFFIITHNQKILNFGQEQYELRKGLKLKRIN